MKNKKILKKLIALVCATTILVGGMTVLPAESKAATASEQLKENGYTKITPENFGIMNEVVHQGSTNRRYQSAFDTLHMKYFEADLSLNMSTYNQSVFCYWGEYLFRFYLVNNTLTVYTSATNTAGVAPGAILQTTVTSGTYFNLKLATSVKTNESNSSDADISYEIWINDVSKKTGTITVASGHVTGPNVKSLFVTMGAGSETVKIRPSAPKEPADPNLPQELIGYTRITPANFNITKEIARTHSKGTALYAKEYNGNKKYNTTKSYFEADIAMKNCAGNDSYLGFLNYKFIQIYVSSSNVLYVLANAAETTPVRVFEVDLKEYDVAYGEYFNLKLATDMKASDTSGKTEVKVHVWINNQLLDGSPKTFNASTSNASGTCLRVQQSKNRTSTIKIKQPSIECVIEYDDISQYRKNGNVAPTAPDGYIFAGWFTKETCELNEAISPTTTSGSAYAKFIDKHLLRIQAQIPADTKDEEGATSKLRFVTSIDSLNYNKVGFTITTNANDKTYGGFDNIVYDKLTVTLNGDGTKDTVLGYTPRHLFGSTAVYYKAWIIEGIPSANYDSEFYATPYLETLDGTIVYGTTATKTVRMGLNQ